MGQMYNKELGRFFSPIKLLALLYFFILNEIGLSQTKCPPFLLPGVGVEVQTSGNGHGSFYSPYFSVTNGRNSFFAGAMIQKRSSKLCGGKITYSRNLSAFQDKSSECRNQIPILDRLQFNLVSYFQYTAGIPLSYGAQRTEELIHRENTVNWSEVRLNTGELGAGMEIRINFFKQFSWRTYIGAAAFYHFLYYKSMDLEQFSAALCMGTGVNYIFSK